MEVGTAEPIDKKKKKLKRKPGHSRLRSSGNDNGNNDDDGDGNNGNGGGGNSNNIPPRENIPDETAPEPTNKSRILMIFLLTVVLMTFGGLIGAYVVIATNKAVEWQPFTQLPFQIWLSTAIILGSSVTYHLAKNFLIEGKIDKSKTWFLVTTALGGIFISSQLIVWIILINKGIYMTGNPYAGFFYILTGIHAVHVLGGISALGYVVLRTWGKADSKREIEKRNNDATAVGWYWHAMGGLWLILLFLLGYIK